VRRDHLIEDAVAEFEKADDACLLLPLAVTFRGEEATDFGGVSREFFHLLAARMFSPDYGMFAKVGRDKYWFRAGEAALPEYRLLGTIVAVAVSNHIVLPIRFPILLYTKMLGMAPGRDDLAEIDPLLVESFQRLEGMRERGENIEDSMLTFSATIDNFGAPLEVPFTPNGQETRVTNGNLDTYIFLYVEWRCNDCVVRQFEGFMSGFLKIFGIRDLEMFMPEELDLLVSGVEVIDWEELKRNTKYIDYTEESATIRFFWAVFDELSQDHKRKLLQFTTGTDRAPIEALRIKIRREGRRDALPIAHTCMLTLCLPPYERKEELRDKLLIALTHVEGFGFV
jgi:hypothetical protein